MTTAEAVQETNTEPQAPTQEEIEQALRDQYQAEEVRLAELKQVLEDVVAGKNQDITIGDAAQEYADFNRTHQATLVKMNEGKVTEIRTSIGTTLLGVVKSYQLEQLMGAPVTNMVVLFYEPSEEHPDGHAYVSINQNVNRTGRQAAGKSKAGTAAASGSRRGGRVKVKNASSGEEMPARDFIAKYGTQEIWDKPLVKYNSATGEFAGKHVTKPEFVEATIENARLTHGETWAVVE